MIIVNTELTNENCGASCNLTCNTQKCRSDCKQCNTENPEICTSCSSYQRVLTRDYCQCKNQLISNPVTGDCLSQCPSGMGKMSEGSYLYCDYCKSPCSECDSLPTFCTQCESPSSQTLDIKNGLCCFVSNCIECSKDHYKDQCINCKEDYSVTEAKLCGGCSSQCLTCKTSNSSFCLSCSNQSLTAIEGNCCDITCLSCSEKNPIICNACKGKYYLNGNPQGLCVQSAKNCDEGLVGVLGLDNTINPGINQCLPECPPLTQLNNENKCSQLLYQQQLDSELSQEDQYSENCLSWENGICTECLNSTYLILNKTRCVEVCQQVNSSTFGDITTQRCHQCHKNCQFCVGETAADCIEIPFSIEIKEIQSPVQFALQIEKIDFQVYGQGIINYNALISNIQNTILSNINKYLKLELRILEFESQDDFYVIFDYETNGLIKITINYEENKIKSFSQQNLTLFFSLQSLNLTLPTINNKLSLEEIGLILAPKKFYENYKEVSKLRMDLEIPNLQLICRKNQCQLENDCIDSNLFQILNTIKKTNEQEQFQLIFKDESQKLPKNALTASSLKGIIQISMSSINESQYSYKIKQEQTTADGWIFSLSFTFLQSIKDSSLTINFKNQNLSQPFSAFCQFSFLPNQLQVDNLNIQLLTELEKEIINEQVNVQEDTQSIMNYLSFLSGFSISPESADSQIAVQIIFYLKFVNLSLIHI
eukprot:TRINITY_DN15637_c0_g1_i1.p1 TRINITY_DN15637_c0_g1~~TRINITY_DN15637_c0_g1_i1.p1  ORF type:complete len:709 (+),score=102.31 TRINITY_DN15637_c0_g1_i1:762-2888(+)